VLVTQAAVWAQLLEAAQAASSVAQSAAMHALQSLAVVHVPVASGGHVCEAGCAMEAAPARLAARATIATRLAAAMVAIIVAGGQNTAGAGSGVWRGCGPGGEVLLQDSTLASYPKLGACH